MKPGYAALGALGLVLLAAAANAADWVKVAGLPRGDECYYDRSKLIFSGDQISYWKKVVFRIPQPMQNGLAASGLFREQIDCAQHNLKLISYLFYSPEGQVIEYVANAKGEATPIIPDSLGDAFEKTMCPMVRQRREDLQRKQVKAEAERAAREAAEPGPCAEPPSCKQQAAPPQKTGTAPHGPASQPAPSPSCGNRQDGPGAEKHLSAPPPCPTMDPSTKAEKR